MSNQAKLSIGKQSTQSTLSFGRTSANKNSAVKEQPKPAPSKQEEDETQNQKMIIEEEEDYPKKQVARSKKRAIVEDDEDQVQGSMMIVEEEQVKSIAPVKTSPNKGPEADKSPASKVTKKAKLDDGKASTTKIVDASPQKPKVEEEKKSQSK